MKKSTKDFIEILIISAVTAGIVFHMHSVTEHDTNKNTTDTQTTDTLAHVKDTMLINTQKTR